MNRQGRVAVAGAGVSGIRAALDLAETGHEVLLLDKAFIPGGVLLALDRQFPNDHCGMCRMLPLLDRDLSKSLCMRLGVFHKNISFYSGTEITDIQGMPGDLKVLIQSCSAGVDPGLCTGCGDCLEACPVLVPHRLAEGLSCSRAIHRPGPNTPPNMLAIDPDACTLCGKCADVCQAGAITLDPHPRKTTLEGISAVIMATGVEYFNPANMYGYGRYTGVVTSLAFERMLSPAGPFQGRLIRPDDGRPVLKIAWIQCVGSRNLSLGADHCSGACCMFALKQAGLAAEKGAQGTIFYMDMRTHGRDWQKYLDKCINAGVRLERCRPHNVESLGDEGLRISYSPVPGVIKDEVFDLVVLSVGRDPGWKGPGFADQDGVLIAEGARRLMDISGSLISASSASIKAADMMCTGPERGEKHAGSDGAAVQPVVMVAGGGPAGLSAALALAGQGVKVIVVEKSSELGGNISRAAGGYAREKGSRLVCEAAEHENIEVLLSSRPVSFSGITGAFQTIVADDKGETQRIEHTALILATGGGQAVLPESLSHPRVMSVFDLARCLDGPSFPDMKADHLVFIQCFETRQKDRNYCSRLCCPTSLACMEKIKELLPECRVTCFYRDIMTPGDLEPLYTRARELGVLFVPYDQGRPPQLEHRGERIAVKGFDPFLDEDMHLEADMVGLGSGLVPGPGHELAEIFGINATQEGFLKEADPKWRPVDSGREGIFICGLARNPVNMDEAVQEGLAAAQRVMRLVHVPRAGNSTSIVRVRPALCSMCGLCMSVCPYYARYPAETGYMEVDPLACQGCLACAEVCPNQACVPADEPEDLRL